MEELITLRAPAGSAGTTIHASASGRAYTVADDGTVNVHQKDIADLIRAGYLPVDIAKLEVLAAEPQSTITQDFVDHPDLHADEVAVDEIAAQAIDLTAQHEDMHAAQAADAIAAAAAQLHTDNAAL